MMRPNVKNARPGRPEHFRTMLIVFAVRHVLGIAVFVYLMKMSYSAGGSYWLVLLAICAAYGAFAVYNGFQLYGQYKRTSKRQALERSNSLGLGA